MAALPDRMIPPRIEGWFAEDPDRPPEAPRRTEVIDGALVLMTSPQRAWHSEVVTALTVRLKEQAPDPAKIARGMTIKRDPRTRVTR